MKKDNILKSKSRSKSNSKSISDEKKKDNNLQNINNYNDTLDHTNVSEIFAKYIGIVQEYLTQICENIYMKNHAYMKYVIKNGIHVISHVFNILLLYTKNLDIVIHHCERSFYYYVEFIGQIGDDNHSFLKLNSKDATLFVYKKTIFDINNEYKKNFNIEDNEDLQLKINCVKNVTGLYNNLLDYIVEQHVFDYENKMSLIKITHQYLNHIGNKLLQLHLLNDDKLYCDKIGLIDVFVKQFLFHSKNNGYGGVEDITIQQRINILEIFISKLKKRHIDRKMFEQRLNNDSKLKEKMLANISKTISKILS